MIKVAELRGIGTLPRFRAVLQHPDAGHGVTVRRTTTVTIRRTTKIKT
jgi:hypothetical protein